MPNTNTTLQLRNGLAEDVATAERHLQAFLAVAARYVYGAEPAALAERPAGPVAK